MNEVGVEYREVSWVTAHLIFGAAVARKRDMGGIVDLGATRRAIESAAKAAPQGASGQIQILLEVLDGEDTEDVRIALGRVVVQESKVLQAIQGENAEFEGMAAKFLRAVAKEFPDRRCKTHLAVMLPGTVPEAPAQPFSFEMEMERRIVQRSMGPPPKLRAV